MTGLHRSVRLILLWAATLFPTAGFSQSSCDGAFALRADTPFAMGFSTARLVELAQWVEKSPARIFSLTISRNGAVIFELYSAGISRDDAHYMMSVTKSATSALVGAALQLGKIDGIEKSICGMLPASLVVNASDERLKRLTLHDAMGMSALDSPLPPLFKTDDAKARQASFLSAPNRLKFALQQKLLPTVGGDFQYNDVTPYLVGGILQYATKGDLHTFAQEALFRPMGFSNSEWMHSDPSGMNNPSYGLRLRPIDMQKFGILYLNKGCWNGRRLLPKDWVERSFTPWIKARLTADRPNEARLDRPNYGWYWWTNWRSNGWSEHLANGWKGQRISVFPTKGVVVTMTGAIEDGSEDRVYRTVVEDFVIPAFDGKHDLDGPSPEPLGNALLKVSKNKKVLEGAPLELRMVPSVAAKERSVPFRP